MTSVRQLAEQGIIPVPPAAFDRLPPLHRRPISFDRAEGMLLGLAIGDALGNTSSPGTPTPRRRSSAR